MSAPRYRLRVDHYGSDGAVESETLPGSFATVPPAREACIQMQCDLDDEMAPSTVYVVDEFDVPVYRARAFDPTDHFGERDGRHEGPHRRGERRRMS
ncbi:MAG: hypothetical protein M0038_04035 [Pseudomonadota bacterium]|jgi:hypothetical protein|nr:hypothetical protein [Pseudomonadota bacterium]